MTTLHFTTKVDSAPGFCAVAYVNEFLCTDTGLTSDIGRRAYTSITAETAADAALFVCKIFTRKIGARKLVFADVVGGAQYHYVIRHMREGQKFTNTFDLGDGKIKIVEWKIVKSDSYENSNSGNEVIEMMCVRLTRTNGESYDDL